MWRHVWRYGERGEGGREVGEEGRGGRRILGGSGSEEGRVQDMVEKGRKCCGIKEGEGKAFSTEGEGNILSLAHSCWKNRGGIFC